jgi:hypothetical protein
MTVVGLALPLEAEDVNTTLPKQNYVTLRMYSDC